MRHILAVTFLILVLAVPWFMLHPQQAYFVYSTIDSVEKGFAAAILFHKPKTVEEIQSRYNNSGVLDVVQKVRILIVPGHEPDYGGAEFGSLKEREMTVDLANNLKELLEKNDRYEVFITRDKNAWLPEFAAYFSTGWDDIAEWIRLHKNEINELTRVGEFKQAVPSVYHNKAREDVAIRLFGVSKWVNENDMDIVLHVHFNDYPRRNGGAPGEYSGFTIYVPQKEYYNSPTTKALADTIFKRLEKYNAVSNLPGESEGIVEDQDLIAVGAFNSVNAASMLIEYGYIYEPQFTKPEIREKAIADLSFQTYLGLQDFFDRNNPVNTGVAFDTLVIPHTWKSDTSTTNDLRDVFALQTALQSDGSYPPINKSKNDCPRTGTLGACTKAALDAFQKRHGITGEKGVIGKKTAETLNRLYGTGVN